MKETNLKSNRQNLIALVMEISTEQTTKDIKSEWADCRTNQERIEHVMECWFTYEQPNALMIVKNLKTGTWNIVETDDELVETENSLDFEDWTGRV